MSGVLTTLQILSEPVALVGWCLFALLIYVWWRRTERTIRILATLTFTVYMILSTPLGANLLLYPIEAQADAGTRCGTDPNRPIIMLTGGIRQGATGPTDLAALHLRSFRRAVSAAQLARERPEASVIVAGGGSGAVREADVIAELLSQMGIERSRLLIERDSSTTFEAGDAILKLMPAVSGRQFELVTSAAHMWRARRVLESRGLDICPHPVDHEFVRPEFPEAFLPQLSAVQKSTIALHEYIGLVLYWLRGVD